MTTKSFSTLCAALFVLCCLAMSGAGALADAQPTTLHPGDKLQVTVYNHPELEAPAGQPTVIDAGGHLWMPVAGLIDASNLTPAQLSRQIEARLAPFVKKPAVNVRLVAQAQSIFLSGAGGGVYPFTPGETLLGALDAVQSALTTNAASANGGLVDPSQVAAHELQNGSLELHHVVILRDGHDLAPVDVTALLQSGDPGPALQPDDTILLAFRPIAVTVRGDVQQTGVAHLDPDQPISDALKQLGGENAATATDRFELTRNGQKQVVTKSTPAYREPAQDGDVVYVPPGIHVGVVGQVATPSRVLLQGDQTLLSAIYYAGGPTKYGDIRHVRLLHDGTQVEYDVTKLTHGGDGEEKNNPVLADGDTVFVPEGHKIDFTGFFNAIFAVAALHAI
jgi:protein involved in polysaccharide export with SLBB domain